MYIHIFIHVYAYTWTYKNASCTHYVMSPAEAWLEERGLEDEVVRPSCSVTSPRSICFSENYYVLYVLYINIYIYMCIIIIYIHDFILYIYIWLYTHVLYRVYVCTDIMSISFIVDLHMFCGCNIMVSAADSSFYRLPHRCIRRYGHKGARSPEVLSDLSVEILCCLGGPTWPDLQSGCLELTRSTMFPAVCQSHKFRSMMTLLGFTVWVNKLVQKDTCLHCCKDPCPLIRSKGFSLIFWGLGLKPCSLDSAQPQSAYVRNHPQPSAAVRDLHLWPCLSGKVSKSVTLQTLQLHIIIYI